MNAVAAKTQARADILFRGVTVAYERHPALHHIDGCFAAGSLTAVVGPNGAGKSTLLKAIAGRMPLADGRIDIGGGMQPRDIAYLPQQAGLDRGFPVTVMELVLMGHWRRRGPFGGIGRAGLEKAQEALAAVGLSGFENRLLSTLSGGQAQRALFARVLVQDSPVILLDEPFNALDSRTVADLLDLLRRWHGEARTVIAVLHDLELARQNFPQALFLARQALAWGKAEHVLTPENQLRARRMAESWDEHAAPCHAGHAA